IYGKPRVAFTKDARTNSVIVAGWDDDIAAASDIINQLDAQPIQDRDQIVYAALNGKVKDMQAALQDFFQKEEQFLTSAGGGGGGGGGGGSSISEQTRRDAEVSVVAHEESNKLLISVSPRKRSQVEALVRQLDTPPPQVMIQVLLAEVTLDDNFEMGL